MTLLRFFSVLKTRNLMLSQRMLFDSFTSKPRISILLNIQEIQKRWITLKRVAWF